MARQVAASALKLLGSCTVCGRRPAGLPGHPKQGRCPAAAAVASSVGINVRGKREARTTGARLWHHLGLASPNPRPPWPPTAVQGRWGAPQLHSLHRAAAANLPHPPVAATRVSRRSARSRMVTVTTTGNGGSKGEWVGRCYMGGSSPLCVGALTPGSHTVFPSTALMELRTGPACKWGATWATAGELSQGAAGRRQPAAQAASTVARRAWCYIAQQLGVCKL